jgi:hypothetical protein
MVGKGRILWYSFAGLWALFLGLVLMNGLTGLSEPTGVDAYQEDMDQESTRNTIEEASCFLSLFGSLIFLAIPAVMVILIVILAKLRYDAVFKNGKRPNVLSPVEEDYRKALEYQRFHNGNTYHHSPLEPPEGFARRRRGRMEIWEYPNEGIRSGRIKHIHADANKLMEMVSERGTGIPIKCPNCGGPVSREGNNVVCDYCGSHIDFETIRNGIMRLLQ